MEGYLGSCLGSKCPKSCCSGGYTEDIEEFLGSWRHRHLNELKKLGINIEIFEDIVSIQNCSDGARCKILAVNEEKDVRSLVCKIFPYR